MNQTLPQVLTNEPLSIQTVLHLDYKQTIVDHSSSAFQTSCITFNIVIDVPVRSGLLWLPTVTSAYYLPFNIFGTL